MVIVETVMTEFSDTSIEEELKSFKVLCIGDPHFRRDNVTESEEMCAKIYQTVDTESPDLIVVMGDVLDSHEHIYTVPLKQATDFLYRLSEIKTTYVLIGNHDRLNNSDFLSEYHPFVGIRHPKLIISSKVIVANIQNFKFVFVPYVPPGRFMEALNTQQENIGDLSTVDCIFAHQEIRGTKMSPTTTSTAGDHWPLNNPYIISGHIHCYSRPQSNVVYCGTPRQVTFGEEEDKSISLFSFDKNTRRFPEERRIDLKLKRRINCRVNCKNVVTWVPPEGCLIKLIIEGTSSEIKAIVKLDYIKRLTKSGIKIVYNTIDEIKQDINKNIGKEEIISRKLPYAERLKTSLQGKPKQLHWFNFIFNKK